MKKILVLLVLMLSLGVALNYALAQEDAAQDTASAPAEAQVTAADLGVADPGILPTSRFYFLKNWGRSMQRALTFNPVKKAELELDIANQQAAEIAKMKEVAPERADAIEKAAANYQANVDRLQNRLGALKETSQNPNIDKLMEKLADRSVKHLQLFDELKQKFEDKPALKQRAEAMQNKMQEALIKIPEKFDSPEKFKERMKKAIEARPDTPLRELRGMEMMEKIKEKLPEDRRAGFEGVKDELMKKFEERINAMPEEAQKTFMVPHILERMPPPGDPDFDLRMKILEDIKGRVLLNPIIREKIETTQGQILEKAAEKGEIKKEKTEEAIKHARELVEKLGIAVNEEGAHALTEGDITRMKNALEQAKRHFDNAKTVFAAGDYGKAFGLAISAESIARNALGGKELFKSQPAPLPIPKSDRVFPETNNRTLCDGNSAPACPRGGILECRNSKWICIESAVGAGREAPGSAVPPASASGTATGGQILCTQEYKPVCGVNGKTYPNACHAKNAGVAVKAPGVCLIR